MLVALLATFLVLDTLDEPRRLVSFAGLLIFLFLGFVFSKHPGHVRSRIAGLAPVFALGLQPITG